MKESTKLRLANIKRERCSGEPSKVFKSKYKLDLEDDFKLLLSSATKVEELQEFAHCNIDEVNRIIINLTEIVEENRDNIPPKAIIPIVYYLYDVIQFKEYMKYKIANFLPIAFISMREIREKFGLDDRQQIKICY